MCIPYDLLQSGRTCLHVVGVDGCERVLVAEDGVIPHLPSIDVEVTPHHQLPALLVEDAYYHILFLCL